MIKKYVLYSDVDIKIFVNYNTLTNKIDSISFQKKDTEIDIGLVSISMNYSVCDELYCNKVKDILKTLLVKYNLRGTNKLLQYLEAYTTYHVYSILQRNCYYRIKGVYYLGYGYMQYEDGSCSDTGFLFSQLTEYKYREIFFNGTLDGFKKNLQVLKNIGYNTLIECDTSIVYDFYFYRVSKDECFAQFIPVDFTEVIPDIDFLGIKEIV